MNRQAEMAAIKREPMNVGEPWMIYDTMIVANEFLGGEENTPGYFTSFVAFSQQERHVFFKLRNEGMVGAAYNDQQSPDTMDYAYEAMSLGVAFFAPGTRRLGVCDARQGAAQLNDWYSAQWWECELPSHCGIQFKVEQDIVGEGPALDFPPGYGPTGGGGALELDNAEAPNGDDRTNTSSYANYSATQGMPFFKCRHMFKEPIGIPRTATLEGILHVSDIARAFWSTAGGPFGYMIPTEVAANNQYNNYPARFGIQFSLHGVRYVQQRGNYHR